MTKNETLFKNNPEKEKREYLAIKKAIDKSNKLREKHEIKLDDFKHIKPKGTIEKHNENVEGKEKEIEEEREKEGKGLPNLANILEMIMFEQMELGSWVTSSLPNTNIEAYTIKTSKYDDYFNGTDLIVEFVEEKEDTKEIYHLGLAVDVTWDPGFRTWNKIHSIAKNIKEGNLTEVEYFFSQNTGEEMRGKLSDLPRVLICLTAETIKELAVIWTQKEDYPGENQKKLDQHWVQFQILEQIKMQLEYFRDYAKQEKQEKILKIFEKNLKKISSILDEKKEEMGETKYFNSNDPERFDEMFGDLKNKLETIFGARFNKDI